MSYFCQWCYLMQLACYRWVTVVHYWERGPHRAVYEEAVVTAALWEMTLERGHSGPISLTSPPLPSLLFLGYRRTFWPVIGPPGPVGPNNRPQWPERNLTGTFKDLTDVQEVASIVGRYNKLKPRSPHHSGWIPLQSCTRHCEKVADFQMTLIKVYKCYIHLVSVTNIQLKTPAETSNGILQGAAMPPIYIFMYKAVWNRILSADVLPTKYKNIVYWQTSHFPKRPFLLSWQKAHVAWALVNSFYTVAKGFQL